MENIWIDKFSKMMLDEDIEFITRKDNILPRYLVKYQTVSENSIESLKNDTVYFNKPSNYNDPYDCSFTMTGSIVENYINEGIEKLKQRFTSQNKKMIYNFRFYWLMDKINKHIKDLCLISCFSTNINSTLMWSHYADSHKGFCTVYDISKEDTSSMFRKNLYPVIYRENKFDLAYYLDESLIPEYPLISCLCWKSDVWSYENECRIILPCTKANDQPKLFNFMKPVYIYLGSNMSQSDEDKIANIALDREIKIIKMSCDSQKYALTQSELIYKRR